MNYKLLYQWEAEVTGHLPCLNSWQGANVALFSYGVVKAESCQQGQVARQVCCGEGVESAARRWRYLFRVTCQTKVVTAEGDYTIAQQVQPGEIWVMSGSVFKKRGQLPAHARAVWSLGMTNPGRW